MMKNLKKTHHILSAKDVVMSTNVIPGAWQRSGSKIILQTMNIETCEHINKETKVIQSIATCETTVTICSDCKKHLDKPKTEC